MSIKLDWDNGSTDIDGYYVYRSESPMNSLNPPAPIATLGKTVKTWIDVNTPRGKLYYYRVSAYKGTEIAITFERAIAYAPYTGPGEPNIVIGDWEAGYFGEIQINELIGVAALINSVGAAVSSPSYFATRWFKMAYLGKVIYMPDFSFGTCYWQNLYTAGLVYGDLDTSLIPAYTKAQLGTVTQNKRIVINDDEFIVRLPRSRKDPSSTSTDAVERGGNEYDMVFAKLFQTRALTQFNPVKGFRSFAIPTANGASVWTADVYSLNSTNIIWRSFYNNSVDAMSLSAWSTNACSYLPVLELVL